jgi:colanic acid/amylovoran biosynthesis glycosyltransferase
VKVAYLVNQYPKVSHSFIRREIHALEQQGVAVIRYALRGWADTLADSLDVAERPLVRYVLQGGSEGLLRAMFDVALKQPMDFLRTLVDTIELAVGGVRPFHHLAYFAEACWLRRALQAEPVDHLHVHFGTNAVIVALLLKRLGGPGYSFTVHGPEEFDSPAALKLREKAAEARFVVAISSYGRGQLMRWLAPADWPKVQVVHCGLASDSFPEAQPVDAASRRFVCVGRLCEQKAQLLLIDAMAQLKAQGLTAELVLAGDGEMRADIEAAIARHGLQSSVRITGWISSAQVRDELLAARALVLPSVAEGLPVVLMEAMALRRPVISTFVAGIPELVHDGVHGWLAPSGDAAAIAQAMAACLNANAEQLHRMGEAARQQAMARHNIDTEAAKLAAHFAAHLGSAVAPQ